MVLIQLSEETEAFLQHQRRKGEGLANAAARIIADAYQALIAAGDTREP